MLEKVEIPPTATSAEFTPPIFSASGYVLMFQCFSYGLTKEASGSPLYRVFLGQTKAVGEEIKRIGWSKRNT
jgi:hypothetical protein